MKIRISGLLSVALAALAVTGCRGNGKAEQGFTALPFPEVSIPGMIDSPQEGAEYMALHYWDVLTDLQRTYPSDSTMASGVRNGDIEQNFVNWIQFLDMTTLQVGENAVRRLCDRAMACERKDTASTLFEIVVDLSEKYLHDPNSPFRNEEHYLHFASSLASYEGFSSEVRDKYAYRARMCSLNRIGTKASDFRFADRRGRIRTLYSIEAPKTLLFFSNPGCEACMNIINVLKETPQIAEMVDNGSLAVLNIYIDEDIQAWRDYMPVYPEQWYNGFDPDSVLRGNTLYNIRAIPSLYLLDSDKRVLLKDAPEQVLYQALGL
ncbi:MAG: DUF5106 domain-containing protein [Bacteroidales bacterium]|nr:DUF5106 domain-containing protein [Bacteroidales bacterium]